MLDGVSLLYGSWKHVKRTRYDDCKNEGTSNKHKNKNRYTHTKIAVQVLLRISYRGIYVFERWRLNLCLIMSKTILTLAKNDK